MSISVTKEMCRLVGYRFYPYEQISATKQLSPLSETAKSKLSNLNLQLGRVLLKKTSKK